MKKQCPVCGRQVRVEDPWDDQAVKRGSAWFATHRDGKEICKGSLVSAIAREPVVDGDAESDSVQRIVMRPCSDCAWTVARIEQRNTGRWTMTCDDCGTCAVGDDLSEVMAVWNDGPGVAAIKVLGGTVRENPDA